MLTLKIYIIALANMLGSILKTVGAAGGTLVTGKMPSTPK